MTKVLYKSYTQNDSLLFPPCIGDFIPENHPVRTVNAILDNFDISEIESTYKGGGTTSYHPRMLLKIVVYAYLTNIYSGRRMASLLEENVFFMWLSGMSRPDFRTINRFLSVAQTDREGNRLNIIKVDGMDSADEKVIGKRLQEIAKNATTGGLYTPIGEFYGFPIKVVSERILKEGLEFTD
ncbi:MAG: transposase, partial [Candidatus Cryptobacteroides sp.]|nr:transposase [Candidatus Cryptobacteroides sp.]